MFAVLSRMDLHTRLHTQNAATRHLRPREGVNDIEQLPGQIWDLQTDSTMIDLTSPNTKFDSGNATVGNEPLDLSDLERAQVLDGS